METKNVTAVVFFHLFHNVDANLSWLNSIFVHATLKFTGTFVVLNKRCLHTRMNLQIYALEAKSLILLDGSLEVSNFEQSIA